MHKNAQKDESKTRSKIACKSYSMVKIGPLDDSFLKAF